MIRRARFAVIGDVAQISSYRLLAVDYSEVLEKSAYSHLDAKAVRNKLLLRTLEGNASLLEKLAQVQAQTEAKWVLRNPQSKALFFTFDARTDIEYAWDDETLSNPSNRADVDSAVINLGSLSEGRHNLFIRTSVSAIGVTQQSDIMQFSVLVDNTPPLIHFTPSN